MADTTPCLISVVAVSSENLVSIDNSADAALQNAPTIDSDTTVAVDTVTETKVIGFNGRSPYISDATNTWWTFSDIAQEYYDTNVRANIYLATETDSGLMSASDKITIDNLADVATSGDFKDISGFKTLTIGNIVFDGTEDKNIPIYDGSTSDPDDEAETASLFTMSIGNTGAYQMKLENS